MNLLVFAFPGDASTTITVVPNTSWWTSTAAPSKVETFPSRPPATLDAGLQTGKWIVRRLKRTGRLGAASTPVPTRSSSRREVSSAALT